MLERTPFFGDIIYGSSLNNEFRKFILVSVFTHAIILFFMWHTPIIKEDIRPYKVTWIKLSKGDGGTNTQSNFKDSKTLPESTLREQKKALKELTKDKTGSDLKSKTSQTKKTVEQKISQKKTSDTGGINLKKQKVPQKDKTLISDALARIDQQLKQREVKLAAAQAKDGDTGQSPFGSDRGSEIDPALIMYFNAIKRKINSQWVIAKKDFEGSLQTKILVNIDARGNILSTSFKKGSGNGSFDASAMRAIKRSAPFPSPPASIKQEALSEGFLIEFSPKTVTGRI